MFSRLNWWQWTALGMSAIWVIIGGLLGYYVGLHESDGIVSGYSFCLDYKPDDWPPCWQLFNKEFVEATKYQWWDVAIVAFVPIPVGWVVMWGLVVSLRWIFRVLHI